MLYADRIEPALPDDKEWKSKTGSQQNVATATVDGS